MNKEKAADKTAARCFQYYLKKIRLNGSSLLPRLIVTHNKDLRSFRIPGCFLFRSVYFAVEVLLTHDSDPALFWTRQESRRPHQSRAEERSDPVELQMSDAAQCVLIFPPNVQSIIPARKYGPFLRLINCGPFFLFVAAAVCLTPLNTAAPSPLRCCWPAPARRAPWRGSSASPAPPG